MSVIVAYSAAATGSPLNKAKPPKHSLNETGKFIILRLTVSPKIFPHCLTKIKIELKGSNKNAS